jgi:hypothetical protein
MLRSRSAHVDCRLLDGAHDISIRCHFKGTAHAESFGRRFESWISNSQPVKDGLYFIHHLRFRLARNRAPFDFSLQLAHTCSNPSRQ